jgi:uncharacterized RDD family membrane protein YckC
MPPNLDRKAKRTVISIEEYQPALDFEEAEHSLPFTFPEYQRELMLPRLSAGLTDFAIVAVVYILFMATTTLEMPDTLTVDKRVLGIYAVCYFAFVAVYFFLFMLSASQTPGMKRHRLIVASKDDQTLDPRQACLRGLGYLISILPVLLGFVWMLIDPEHLTWADKVSGTYVKRI